MPGDAISEHFEYPFPEIPAFPSFGGCGALEPEKTFGHDFPGKMPEVVLEGIGNETIPETDPAGADMIEKSVIQKPDQEFIEISVMREEDMAADIPGKAPRVKEAGGKPPDIIVGFVQVKGFASQFSQPEGASKTRGPPADYHNPFVHIFPKYLFCRLC
jgi:hypothetical protein